eukprot:m51a1_g5609 hypothetical protein (962) ;mRNA; f:710328-714219
MQASTLQVSSLQTSELYYDTHVHLDLVLRRANLPVTSDALAELMRSGMFGPGFACAVTICVPDGVSTAIADTDTLVRGLHETGTLRAAYGVHPHNAKDYTDDLERQIVERVVSEGRTRGVVAWGEMGLDYHYDMSPRDVQRDVFRRQLRLAVESHVPVVVHSREAEADTLEIMGELCPPDHPVHLHCFTGKWDFASAMLNKFPGLRIGLTGCATFKSAPYLREVAQKIDIGRLLLETDGPFMAPEPHRGKLAHPGHVPLVAATIAKARGCTLEDVLSHVGGGGGGGASAAAAPSISAAGAPPRRVTQFICVTPAGDLPMSQVGWRPTRAGASAVAILEAPPSPVDTVPAPPPPVAAAAEPAEGKAAVRVEASAQRRVEKERDALREQVAVLTEQVAQLTAGRAQLKQHIQLLTAQLAQAELDREQMAEELQTQFSKVLAKFARSDGERRASEQHRMSMCVAIQTHEAAADSLADRAAALAERLQAMAEEDAGAAVADEFDRKMVATRAEWRARYEEARRAGKDPLGEQLANPFAAPDSESNIQYIDTASSGSSSAPQQSGGASRRELLCATPEKLIERLTTDTPIDPDIMFAFLLTFRTFITPLDLLKKLVIRYRTASGPRTDERASAGKAMLVQIRVCKVIQTWIDRYPHDFDDAELRTLLYMFVYVVVRNSKLAVGIIRNLSRDHIVTPAPMELHLTPPPPLELFGASEGDPFVMRLAPIEFARQLALLDSEQFLRIQCKELLNPKGWQQPVKDTSLAPNVVATIRTFNRVSQLLQSEILSVPDRKRRCDTIRHLVQAAHECVALGDFSAAIAIGAALHAGPILRLQKTFEYLNKKVLLKKDKQQLSEIQALMDNTQNWRKLRVAHETATLPAVPHLGAFLMDLTMLEETPDTINGLVNFSKRRRVAAVVQRIMHFQQKKYTLTALPQVREWIEQAPVKNDDQLFDISEALEPRTPSAV